MSISNQSQTPPILFIVFNRLETVKRTLEAIKKVSPKQIFISADGPRISHLGEDKACQAVRNYIIENIDWECEVKTRFLEKNLGCKAAVSSAIDWFFSEVEEGIILEDDCLPGEDFFRYATAALAFYRNIPSVMHINGTAIKTYVPNSNECAYLYRYAHVWGWATWRRAWKLYDVNFKNFDSKKIYETFPNDKQQAKRWNEILSNVISDKSGFNTWDFQWTYTIMTHKAWCVSPTHNLITNIGIDQSTHDMENVASLLNTTTFKMPKVLNFPTSRNSQLLEIEQETYLKFYKKKNIISRIFSKISKIFLKLK